MKRVAFTVLFISLALFTTWGWSASSIPADWPKKLVFAVVPTESAANMKEHWGSLVAYLEKKLGIPVEFMVANDYAGVITAMQFQHAHLAYFGPKSYIEAALRANAEAFAKEVGEEGVPGYHGLIIARKDSPINSIEDAKGKIFAFVDPNSTSGTLVPMVYFIKEKNIDPDKYFSKVIYSGSHEASILAVKSGKVDLASTNDLDLKRGEGKMWQTEKDFKILWKSQLIPASPMAYHKSLPDSLKKALKEAILSFNDPEGLKKLKIKGYVEASDGDYDPIRKINEVKKELDQKKKSN
ncbi:MAG: phosphonate ABC transporter substrate-binding protein [Syntrophobacterales bacterium]|nr:phosphonate ABC transporter substrate-binding protein [Syntrophobacterales bacterium]